MAGSPDLSDAKLRLLEILLRGEGSRAPIPALRHRSAEGPRPLSPGERQIWRHAQLADLPIYNEPITVHRTGSLDHAALRRSLTEIVRRHDAWRTAFPEVGGEARPDVRAPFEADFAFDDLGALPLEERETHALALAAGDARRPFDLARPPLFRARLVRMGENVHRLYLTLHHIIFDGVALYHVFLPELALLHDAFAAGLPSPLPEPAPAYSAFAAWSAEREPSGEDLSYWRATLADLPSPLDLPADRVRPPRRTFHGAMLPLEIDAAVSRGVHALAESGGTTSYVVLLSAFEALLHRYTGRDDFLVGSVTAGRDRSDFERVMGFFLNTVPLRAPLSNDPSFSELVARNRGVVLGALSHGSVPFERLVREFETDPSPDRNPFFSVLFSLEPPMARLPEGWGLTQIDVQTGTSKFDLSLELDERPPGIVGRFIYNTDLFDRETIGGLERHWRALLESALEDPERPISDLAPHGTMPRDAAPETVGLPAPVEFLRRASETPSAEALRFGGRTTTYGDLAARVRRLAAALRRRGIGRESIVAVALPRSADRVAALLAVGCAGAAWLPLGADWPAARIAAILAASAPALVISADADPAFEGFPGTSLDALESGDSDAAAEALPAPGDLAYVLYTSGSTGAPKGVMIEHRALSNLLAWSQRAYPLGAGDRVLQKAPLEFDASVWEIFAPLVAGAALVIAPPGIDRDPAAIASILREERVTHLKLVPSLLRMLVATPGFGEASALRHVFSGGETLPPDLADAFFGASRAELHNLYGPTETCVDVAAHRCRPGAAGRRVPIGRAIDGARLHVLDAAGRPVAPGIPGELHVGGLPLARGYLGLPARTRERFVDLGAPFGRVYRTGDRVRTRSDGEIEFLGRIDDQRKIRGVRVEPGEIEASLRAASGVEDAVVVVRGEDAAAAIAAYVASPEAADPGRRAALARALRERLSAVLPASIVPETITVLPSLPTTAAGKVDRRALPDPERLAAGPPQPPESAEQRLLAEIWSAVLGLPGVGIHDNLFDLGGNSLLVFQIAARASRSGYRVTPRQLFEHPTIAELAEAAGALSAASAAVEISA